MDSKHQNKRKLLKALWPVLFIYLLLGLFPKAYAKEKIPGDIELSNLLSGIKNGSYVFRPMLINDMMTNLIDTKKKNPSDPLVKRYETNQKIKYPKWDWSNLYFQMAIIEGYEYRVFFETTERKCLLAIDEKNKMKKFRQCAKEIKECVFSTVAREDYKVEQVESCRPDASCTFEEFDKGREIDKTYCEALYKKSL